MLLEQDNVPVEEATGDVGAGRIWKAAQEVGMTMTESFFQTEARKTAAKIGKKLSPEEANTRFPGLEADREISEGEAQYLHDWKKERAENQRIIDSASDSFLKGTALPFVAGAAESLKDPAEVAIGLLTGGIGNGLAKGATLGRKIAIDAAEASVSQMIAEVPIALEQRESFEEYTAEQFLQNAVLAAAMQVGVTHGASAAFKGTAKALKFAGNKTTENLMKLQKHMEAQGISSTKALNDTITVLKNNFSEIDNLKGTISKNFPDMDMSKVDNFEDAINPVIARYKKGEITDEQLSQFTEQAIQEGADPQLMKSAVDDSAYEFSDEVVDQVKRDANSPESKFWHEDRYDNELNELEGFNPDSVDEQVIQAYNESIQNIPEEALEEIVELPDGKQGKVKDLIEMSNNKKQEQQFFSEFASCLRGAN